MKPKTIAAIALSGRDFPSFGAKLAEAVRWIEFAAQQGAELAVLPEAINLWRGDGPGNPNALTLTEAALADWQKQTAPLIEAARRLKIGLTVPVVVRERKNLWNSCFFISRTGRVVGRYDKINPTIGELKEGVRPGKAKLVEWEGLRVGGAICFDTEFQNVFAQQAALGAELFVVPSLWPGGRQLNHYAGWYGTPIVIAYPAWSRIINYDGAELAAGGERWETLRFGFGAPVLVATLNFDYVILHGDGNQEKMVAVQRKYGRRLRVRFDQDNTLFYLESLVADLTATDVVKEFGLEPIRKYFARYHRLRAQYAAN